MIYIDNSFITCTCMEGQWKVTNIVQSISYHGAKYVCMYFTKTRKQSTCKRTMVSQIQRWSFTCIALINMSVAPVASGIVWQLIITIIIMMFTSCDRKWHHSTGNDIIFSKLTETLKENADLRKFSPFRYQREIGLSQDENIPVATPPNLKHVLEYKGMSNDIW